ncbi:hypothetical protein [Maribacter luteus]|uniref:hypothetical protein n=1 Tax=Maribacter luteus TaxID=2594478 RepID=UPI0024924B1C|nr:hypothetical protein [Maribacter luteus]
MNRIVIFFITAIICQSCTQTKQEYLKENRFDLSSSDFNFPECDFNIIGFGAYHGSSKTENVELELLESLTKKESIKYYFPETDFSLGHYFNEYLKNGDTLLLKDLVTTYGNRVPQERTIEVYEKWKKLRQINEKLPNSKKLTVIGIDLQVNYKYASKHILDLIKPTANEPKPIQAIRQMVMLDTASWRIDSTVYSYTVLKDLIRDYESNKQSFLTHISNTQEFEHIVENLKYTFQKERLYRDQIMFKNYQALDSIYNFKENPQFLRMGFSHIVKSREGKEGYPYFFTRLIENKVYDKSKVLTVMGYLTDSKVVWDELYDEEGNYEGYTIEGGYGIGDYEKEYFRGIQNLKDNKISDRTLFRLNKCSSPYIEKEPDLMEVIMQDEKSNGERVKGMSTLEFIDYAVLISDSKESIPIFEMK